jgi:hypothetical protein
MKGYCYLKVFRCRRAARVLCLLPLAVGVLFEPAALGQRSAGEYEVKAAVLYNFAKFVEWPDDAFANDSAPLVIGVVGDNPFGNGLEEAINGKTAGGRTLAIRHFSQKDDLRNCHMLFVCASQTRRVSQILAAVSEASVLTVSDIEGFLAAGGMINLVMENGHVRFLIRASAATRVRLKISSKLLSLARNPVD